jgi:hypothetical protein
MIIREILAFLAFLAKLAIFFLIVGVILGVVVAESAHGIEGRPGEEALFILIAGSRPLVVC